jgi:hypothetical protein
MMDFLKAYPSFTVEDYLWRFSLPMLKVMMYDASKTLYLSEKDAKKYHARHPKFDSKNMYTDPDALLNDLGLPTFTKATKKNG